MIYDYEYLKGDLFSDYDRSECLQREADETAYRYSDRQA